jgi:putative transposase
MAFREQGAGNREQGTGNRQKFKTAHALMRTDNKVFFVEDLNLKGLSKRNKVKKDINRKYLPNGQSAKSGLNKSWLDAAFGNFYETLSYIAEKAGAVVKKVVNPAYTSQLLSYRDEFVFTDCSIRDYYDPIEKIKVDRDINSSIAYTVIKDYSVGSSLKLYLFP